MEYWPVGRKTEWIDGIISSGMDLVSRARASSGEWKVLVLTPSNHIGIREDGCPVDENGTQVMFIK